MLNMSYTSVHTARSWASIRRGLPILSTGQSALSKCPMPRENSTLECKNPSIHLSLWSCALKVLRGWVQGEDPLRKYIIKTIRGRWPTSPTREVLSWSKWATETILTETNKLSEVRLITYSPPFYTWVLEQGLQDMHQVDAITDGKLVMDPHISTNVRLSNEGRNVLCLLCPISQTVRKIYKVKENQLYALLHCTL